jgi:hypothetical protein
VVRGAAVAAACALLGCRQTADHERIGDRRYAEGAFRDALAEYRLAARQRSAGPQLLAKVGLAALRAEALPEAGEAYAQLARTDAAGRAEAAEGLLRTARRAIAARDLVALRRAVAGLHEVAPSRLGELGAALSLVVDTERRSAADEELLLAASARSEPAAADSLLVAWAELVAAAGRCDEAQAGHDAVRRRSGATLARPARDALAGCRVEQGRRALGEGRLAEAEAAFLATVEGGGADSTVRLAWLLAGDTRWAGGDTVGAVSAYGRAIQGGDPEHAVVRRAEEQLRRLLGTSGEP